MSNWDQSGFEAALRAHAARKLAAAAVKLVAAHQKNLSVANPSPHANPAPKGSFPRGRTYFLRANIGFVPSTLPQIAAAGRVTVGVFPPAEYGVILKHKGWLGLADTWSRSKRDILRGLKG